MKNRITKNIILAIDYELFLGNVTGDVFSCMIQPTTELANILEVNGSKMTVFWDVLHYYRLIQLENKYKELAHDRKQIEEQILNLVQNGHDVQMHLHPHWLDAVYESNKWVFSYNRFDIHSLDKAEDNENHIDTILGCVTIAKNILEELIIPIKPDYKVTTYRAGGYLVYPFSMLSKAMKMNGIFVDSSICPNLKNYNNQFSYDHTDYPAENFYYFNREPKIRDNQGDFIEIPIKTIRLSALTNLFFTLIRKYKYPLLEENRLGTGAGAEDIRNKKSIGTKIINLLFHSRVFQLSTDNSFKEKISFLLKQSDDYSTMILHPKLLNNHTLSVLNAYTSKNKIIFSSINNYLNIKDICKGLK